MLQTSKSIGFNSVEDEILGRLTAGKTSGAELKESFNIAVFGQPSLQVRQLLRPHEARNVCSVSLRPDTKPDFAALSARNRRASSVGRHRTWTVLGFVQATADSATAAR